jgi:magnesium chelatase subunit H
MFSRNHQANHHHAAAQAFANVLKRMLEASGRGMWKADEATLQKLRDMYEDMDAQLEGVR